MTRKNNIPCSRADLLNRICASNRLSADDKQQFREFGDLLTALIHFQSHQQYERMKGDLLASDGHEQQPYKTPTGNTQIRSNTNHDAPAIENVDLPPDGKRIDRLIADFAEVLSRANYHPIDHADIKDALNKASIIPVRTAVNFSDYDEIAFYYRNKTPRTVKLKRFLSEKELIIQNYDRMVVMLKTAKTVETQASKNLTTQIDNLTPQSIYLNLYKNIPHGDLELLFPNIKISMTLKDKLMLGIPALGAAVPLALKILPSLGLLIGVIALTVFGFELGGEFEVDPESQKATYALLTAMLSIGLALGGFAAQQYLKYKSKRLSFLKKVADTLFFKTLDVGKGVISSLVDEAEEEQCKETLLTYFVLFTSKNQTSEQDLDRAAEAWLANEFEARVDFKVAKALEEITGLTAAGDESPIISCDDKGLYQVCGLLEAKQRLDRIWDNAFPYSVPAEVLRKPE